MPPTLSLVVLAWENLPLTQECVASLRTRTQAHHELIVVDNGSGPDAADYARTAADTAVLHETNLGFAAGMNAGLEAATGQYVAFVNNDTVFPEGWDTPLLEHFDDPSVGIVAPAVTAAGNPITVREKAGTEVVRLLPFGEFPSGVVYVMRRNVAIALGGWNEEYPVASAEDLDLCFTVWANGLDIVLDTRTLIDHVSQATVGQLPNQGKLYAANLDQFLSRWGDSDNRIPSLPQVTPDELARNLSSARVAVRWIERMVIARRDAASARREIARLEEQLREAHRPRHLPRWLDPRRDRSRR